MRNEFGLPIGGYVAGQATAGTPTTLTDASKNMTINEFLGSLIMLEREGVQYLRKISGNTATVFTFPALDADTFASVVWTVATGITITIADVAGGAGGNDYSVVAALAIGNNKPLAVALVGKVITVTLATGAAGASNDAANTVALVTAAIDALDGFSAVSAGLDTTVVAPHASMALTGGTTAVTVVEGTTYQLCSPVSGGPIQLSGSKVQEQLINTDAVAGVLTFADNINAIEIYNTDTVNAGTFEVNGITLNVPKSTLYRTGVGGTPAKTVTVAGSTTYIVSNLI